MQEIKIKLLSSNEMYNGRKVKSKKYKNFEIELSWKLKKEEIPSGKLMLIADFGLSSKNADWDNPIKSFQDVLQYHYKFNDKRIYRGDIQKHDVPKGEEYVKFKLVPFISRLM